MRADKKRPVTAGSVAGDAGDNQTIAAGEASVATGTGRSGAKACKTARGER